MNSFNGIELVMKGELGSCWDGKYHYLEPWSGCEHNCPFCYARGRDVVKNTMVNLPEKSSSFERISLLAATEEKLLHDIELAIERENVYTLKLCRYTDFFTPEMVKRGLSYHILKMICEKTKVERMIITTKGYPDQKSIELMGKYPDRFSFNMVLLPEAERPLLPFAYDNKIGMKIATEVQALNVKTTIHFDPIGLSIFSNESEWDQFLRELYANGLKRVMFSYMVLDSDIASHLKKKMPTELWQKFFALFDWEKSFKYNYADKPIIYMNVNVRQEHIDMLANLLRRYNFEFVLCSLKNTKGDVKLKLGGKTHCPSCAGDFYA